MSPYYRMNVQSFLRHVAHLADVTRISLYVSCMRVRVRHAQQPSIGTLAHWRDNQLFVSNSLTSQDPK